jgi:hypothetical protein
LRSLEAICPITPVREKPEAQCRRSIAPVEEVVTVIDVADVDDVAAVPVVLPVFRPRVHDAEPIPAILEAGLSSHDTEGEGADPESMVGPEVPTVARVGDPVAVVAAALPRCGV